MEKVYNAYLSEKINDSFGGYAIYLRKSRADAEAETRGEGETLARHEKMLLDLAEKIGIKIGKIYREIVSGETIEARPEIQKLLSDVKKGMWKGVLVVEVERLARGETMDQGIVAKAFKISDTKIITPMKTYDPMMNLMKNILNLDYLCLEENIRLLIEDCKEEEFHLLMRENM